MNLDRWLALKVISWVLFMPLIMFSIFKMRAQALPPPSLIWALTICYLLIGWGSFNDWIREAELIETQRKHREAFLDKVFSKKISSYEDYLARLDGLIGWEKVQSWFYEMS